LSQLSKIVLGTMRFDPERHSPDHWVQLLRHAHEGGVRRLHCSDEYDSFPFLLRVLEALRVESPELHFDFVVKLAEPSFDVHEFSEHRLFEHLDRYRNVLAVDELHAVQWMWRGDLSNDRKRIVEFGRHSAEVVKAADRAKRSGHVGSFFCFPYSHAFATCALENDSIDGLAIYRNPQETEYDDLLKTCGDSGRSALVIRPFAAGDALNAGEPGDLIRYSARVPEVTGIIVSCGSVGHLEECIHAAHG
jgi:aryl-alcohol dehydrogenase-like predicted oxidoreductase